MRSRGGYKRVAALVLTMALLTFTLVAGTHAQDETMVSVRLTEFDIEMPTSIPAGMITFEVTNAGTVEHSFAIEGQGIEESLDDNLQPGETRTMEVQLEPGTYEVYCPVENHADMGMRLELTVTEAAQEATGTPADGTPAQETPEPTREPEGVSVADVAQPDGQLPGGPQIALVMVADGLVDPVNVASANDGSGRLFVVERPGTVRIVQDGELLEQPFLDITDMVLSAMLEQGLYDIEFDPDFAENGYFYVHFAELMRNGDGMIVRYEVSADDPNVADPESAQVILQLDQPYANHNGGELAFGPDGYLYIGNGDGGWEGDPLEAGQDLSTLLGKLLRIDVHPPEDSAQPYVIPPDNPFAQPPVLVELFGIPEDVFAEIHTQARPEIWAYGLRNPWKFSFDPETGDLYLPDVGQNVWEEINFQAADSEGGENYGWDFLMGTHCHPIQAEECPTVGVLPVAEYSHDYGSAVIGIGVYRGEEFPALDGIYFAGDYGSGRIFGLAHDDAGEWQFAEVLDSALRITGGGPGEDGTLYVTSCNCFYGGRDPFQNEPGALWRIVAADAVPEDAETAPLDGTATPEAEISPTGTPEAEESPTATPEAEMTPTGTPEAEMTPTPQAGEAPPITHTLEGREDCLPCHAPDSAVYPAPEDHEGLTVDTCTTCHQPQEAEGEPEATPEGEETPTPTSGEAEVTPPSMEEATALLSEGGCGGCHTVPGVSGATGNVGPNICVPAEKVQSGDRDLEFLHESIVDPDAEIAEGFSGGLMPNNYDQVFSEEELDMLVAFIATLDCP